jgi:hypothetical protein
MVAYLDSPLVIQYILKILVGLIRLLIDLIADQQKLYSHFWASLYAHSQVGVRGLDFILTTIWVGAIINGTSIIITID